MADSKIEWTDAVWNPTSGCTRASAGCDHCYAFTMTKRLAAMGQTKYQGLTGKGHFNGVMKTHDDELQKPLRWKKPRRVFVNSMSDLFHDGVPFEFIDKVFSIMAICPQHTFQVLTKRPELMAEYLTTIGQDCRELSSWDRGSRLAQWCTDSLSPQQNQNLYDTSSAGWWESKRMPNVWLGASVENEEQCDERIEHLTKCPAAVRFVSFEPLLESVDPGFRNWADSEKYGIHWAIIGGESGHGARPCHVRWVRLLVEDCQLAGVPCFVKQLGANCVGAFDDNHQRTTGRLHLSDRKGGDWNEWPADLRVREFPSVAATK